MRIMSVRHVGTGPHGFPVMEVTTFDEQDRASIESADPRELVRELRDAATAQGLAFECQEPLPEAPAKPLPGFDPIGDLLEQQPRFPLAEIDRVVRVASGQEEPNESCSRCGLKLEPEDDHCPACAVAGGGI